MVSLVDFRVCLFVVLIIACCCGEFWVWFLIDCVD